MVPIASMYGKHLPTITQKYQLIVGKYYLYIDGMG